MKTIIALFALVGLTSCGLGLRVIPLPDGSTKIDVVVPPHIEPEK